MNATFHTAAKGSGALSVVEHMALHGVSADAVAPRSAALESLEMQELIWFLQGRLLEPRGAFKVASEIWEMFPERRRQAPRSKWQMGQQEPTIETLAKFLAQLCINPSLRLGSLAEVRASEDEFPGWDGQSEMAECAVLKDVLGALKDYKCRCEAKVRSDFVLTKNGEIVWKTLGFARTHGEMVLINGREGRGKSEAAKADCRASLGRQRYVGLRGFASKGTVLHEIATALGLPCGASRSGRELVAGIQYVLKKSRLMLVIDEAHFLFNPAHRNKSRPELLDWIWSLSNDGIAIALVTTPQFLTSMEQAAADSGWNWLQFRRRIKRYEELGDTSIEEVKAVFKALVPEATPAMVKLAAGFVAAVQKDLSALGDLVRESRIYAKEAGREKINFSDLERAAGALMEMDKVFALSEERILKLQGKRPVSERRGPEVMAKGKETNQQTGSNRIDLFAEANE